VAEVNTDVVDFPPAPAWVSPGASPHVAELLWNRTRYAWPARVTSRPGDAVEVAVEGGFTVGLPQMRGRDRWVTDRTGAAVPGPISPMSAAAARPLVQVNQSRIVYRGPGEVDAVTARALVKALEAAADALDG
jgi:hypothetical protein